MRTNIPARTRARRAAAPGPRLNLFLAAAVAGCAFTARAQQATLDPVLVTGVRSSIPAGAKLDADALRRARANSSDTARLLSELPGVSLYGAGGVSSLPSVHGLADDRLRIQLDGMDLLSACGNHMNPPLSYIDPTRVDSVKLFAGIVPVSMGGDSIGAAIEVESPAPEFVAPGQPSAVHGEAGAQYRSNGNGQAAHASATFAAAAWSLRYDGSVASSDDYRVGRDFKAAGPAASDKPGRWLRADEVGSSGYLTRNQALTVATRRDGHLLQLKLGTQDIGLQGFPNQRMDMTRNDGTHVNLLYRGEYAWGHAQVRAYAERTRHSMNFADDKQFGYGPSSNVPGMPMETEGRNVGLQGKAEVRPTATDTVRVGVEAQRYQLDDWWPPSGGGMAPDTFRNIRDGRRQRLDAFGEWESRWSEKWLGSVGLRSANVTSDAGPVQGYNPGYATDANAFNARDRKRVDHNVDVAALVRYAPGAMASYEFGYAHKSRSPNLYERYAWSTGGMAMRMVNMAGDGNGYVGNLDLRPEVADTLSATVDWHDAAGESWQFRFTPYVTHVRDYIDAARCAGGGSTCNAANAAATQGFVYLQFANDDARLHGVDVSGFVQVARTRDGGTWTAVGQLGYVRGRNLTTGDGLYNIMPLNTRLALVQHMGAWTATAEVQLVAGKTRVSEVRNELKTGGYGLMNLRASYEWSRVRLDVGIENLFDRFYSPPLGGAYVGQGRTMAGTAVPWGVPVPGKGRSVNLAVAVKY